MIRAVTQLSHKTINHEVLDTVSLILPRHYAQAQYRRVLRSSNRTHKEEGKMKTALKITAAIACSLLVGGGAVELLHAQSKPPAFVVAEVAVKDKEGFDENFLKPTTKD